MANYQQLKNALVDVIKQNGNNEITGEIMQTTLLSMINSLGANYQFAGILTPSTSFVPTDENIFFIGGAGSYSNFGASTINVPTGCICIFTYNGSFASSILYVGGVVDISRLTNTSYASLSLALANVPSFLQVGGLEIMYQDSTSGNYVKYHLMATSWSTNITDWQGVDDKPLALSSNIVESGGVYLPLSKLDGGFHITKKFPPVSQGETYINIGELKKGDAIKINFSTTDALTTENYLRLINSVGTVIKLLTISSSTNSVSAQFVIPSDDNYRLRIYVNDVVTYNIDVISPSSLTCNFDKVERKIIDITTGLGSSNTDRNILPYPSYYFKTEVANFGDNTKYQIYLFDENWSIIKYFVEQNTGILIKTDVPVYGYQIYWSNAQSDSNIKLFTGEVPNLEYNVNKLLEDETNNTFTIPAGTPSITYLRERIQDSKVVYIKCDSIDTLDGLTIFFNRAEYSTISYVVLSAKNYNIGKWLKFEFDENVKWLVSQQTSTNTNPINILYSTNANFGEKNFSISSSYLSGSLKLYNKKAAFCGDSIMKGDSDRPHQGSWADVIGKNNLMNYTNFGVSGATIGRSSQEGRGCIQDQVTALDDTYDYIIIQGGCNDGGALTDIGQITEGYNEEFDRSTLYGGLEYLCKYMSLNFSTKKYGFIITYNFGEDNIQSAIKERMNAIANVCNKWGVPYIDLRECAGFNLVNKELREIYGVPLAAIPLYSSTSGYSIDDRVKVIDGAEYKVYKCNAEIPAPAGVFDVSLWTQINDGSLWDSWHANHVAYEQSSPKVEAWMKSL